MESLRHSEKSPQFSTLVGDIVVDVQKLVRQEFTLAKSEAKRDWVRAKNAVALFAGAYLTLALGIGFALLALARGLVELGFPLGLAYVVIAGILVGVGTASYLLARRWMLAISIVPEGAQLKNHAKENVEWLRKHN